VEPKHRRPAVRHETDPGPDRGWWGRYLARHRHPACRVLHAVGVPLLAVGLLLAMVQLFRGQWSLWWRPVVLLAASYLLQWLGHRIEGNDMGEVVLIKKLLGRPYVAVAPRDREVQSPVSDAMDSDRS